MNQRRFWLASNSPRRREMLSWSHWEVISAPSRADETRMAGETAQAHVQRLAALKCGVFLKDAKTEDFVIAADTIVVIDGKILGKPRNAQHAFEILSDLRGKTHHVMTAIAIRHAGEKEYNDDLCRSPVTMREYSDLEIQAYIDSGDPMDKAGAYAIQNLTFSPAVGFSGCFASVMGLPLCHMERILRKFADYDATDWPKICQFHLEYDCPISKQVMQGEGIG